MAYPIFRFKADFVLEKMKKECRKAAFHHSSLNDETPEAFIRKAAKSLSAGAIPNPPGLRLLLANFSPMENPVEAEQWEIVWIGFMLDNCRP